MSNAVQSNALTELQSIWGGTHDALLGVLLWMYNMPTYSLNRYGLVYIMCILCVYYVYRYVHQRS